MKGLASLVRLHRWRLDDKRKHLAELERTQDEMQAQRGAFAVELENERRAAASSLDAVRVFPAYLAALTRRREALETAIGELKGRIAAVAEEAVEAYKEFKKHEKALANREERRRRAEDRAQRIEEDEVGLNIFRHRQGG